MNREMPAMAQPRAAVLLEMGQGQGMATFRRKNSQTTTWILSRVCTDSTHEACLSLPFQHQDVCWHPLDRMTTTRFACMIGRARLSYTLGGGVQGLYMPLCSETRTHWSQVGRTTSTSGTCGHRARKKASLGGRRASDCKRWYPCPRLGTHRKVCWPVEWLQDTCIYGKRGTASGL